MFSCSTGCISGLCFGLSIMSIHFVVCRAGFEPARLQSGGFSLSPTGTYRRLTMPRRSRDRTGTPFLLLSYSYPPLSGQRWRGLHHAGPVAGASSDIYHYIMPSLRIPPAISIRSNLHTCSIIATRSAREGSQGITPRGRALPPRRPRGPPRPGRGPSHASLARSDRSGGARGRPQRLWRRAR